MKKIILKNETVNNDIDVEEEYQRFINNQESTIFQYRYLLKDNMTVILDWHITLVHITNLNSKQLWYC